MNKPTHNRFVNELMVLYYNHCSIVSKYVKSIEDEIWYKRNGKYGFKKVDLYHTNLSYKVYSYVANVSNKLIKLMYDDMDKWCKYHNYRQRYETPKWWRKKYKKILTPKLPNDIKEVILDYVPKCSTYKIILNINQILY